MRVVTLWKKIAPSSSVGYSLQITQTYSSFKESEIDELQEKLAKSLAAVTVVDTSVDVKMQKRGQWVRIEPYPLQTHDFECSECGHEVDDNTLNYCAQCGSFMQ